MRTRRSGWTRAGIVAAAVVGLVLLWHQAIRDHVQPRNFGEVVADVLYRSGRLKPSALEKVAKAHGIRTIVDLGAWEPESAEERIEQETAQSLGIQRHVFRLEGDGTGNPNAYVEALRIMSDPTKAPVLVHCSAGSQRTSGAIILYREIFENRPITETYEESFLYRHDPADNPHLRPFLEKWHDQIKAAVESESCIPGCDPVRDEQQAVPEANSP